MLFNPISIHFVNIYGKWVKESHGWREKAVFEQLTLGDFKMWSSTTLKAFNNYSIIMTNYSDSIRISCVWCCFVSVANYWVNLVGCSYESHVVFKYFEGLKNSILNILEETSLASLALVTLKLYKAFRIK